MRGASSPRRSAAVAAGAALSGAALLVATAAMHLDLYLTGYRTIPTIGVLFLLQVITAFALAAAVLGTLRQANGIGCQLASGAGALFALATLGGYLLSLSMRLFGFKEVRTTAGLVAGIIEIAAFCALAFVALPLLSVLRVRLAGVAAGAVAVVAVALLAAGYASASGGATAQPAGGLRVGTVHGVSVLTNSAGQTLYWFQPDTSTASKCYGDCVSYWPPVLGKLAAGPGVTGTIGTITRTGGALQTTYDGHPLYTYVGDGGPGTATGNNIDLNGGYWYEVKP